MSSARFAQCYLCSLEVLRGVSHGATEVGAGGRGRRSPFHQQQRRTGICLQLALDLPDGTMAATMTPNKPPQNPSPSSAIRAAVGRKSLEIKPRPEKVCTTTPQLASLLEAVIRGGGCSGRVSFN